MDNMKSKKAFTLLPEYLVGLILALVIVVLFLPAIGRAGEQYQRKAYDDLCNQWIQKAIFSERVRLSVDPNEAPCKSEDFTIDEKETFDILNEVFSKKAACYNSYNRGDSQIFRTDGRLAKYCAVCYKINFTNKEISINGWEYLMAQKSLRANRNERFIEIFAPYDFARRFISDNEFVDNFVENNPVIEMETLNTNNEYLIVFTFHRARPGFWDWAFNRAILQHNTEYFMGDYTGFGTKHTNGDYWEGVFLVEFTPENMRGLDCQTIVGIQQPGITSSS